MVLCSMPGTRPAPGMFCMMCACCSYTAIMSCRLCLGAHFDLKASVFVCIRVCFFLVFTSVALGFAFHWVWCDPVSWCADGENMCCLLFQLQYLPPPWGDCKSTPIESDFFSTYSITACRIDCETRYLLENCNCRMVHMPGMSSAWPGAERSVLVSSSYLSIDYHLPLTSNRDFNGLYAWAVQRLCRPSFRWAHALHHVQHKILLFCLLFPLTPTFKYSAALPQVHFRL